MLRNFLQPAHSRRSVSHAFWPRRSVYTCLHCSKSSSDSCCKQSASRHPSHHVWLHPDSAFGQPSGTLSCSHLHLRSHRQSSDRAIRTNQNHQTHAEMGKTKDKQPQGDAGAAAKAAKPKGANKPVDPRFAAVQTDPRFQRFPAPRKPVTIDERFAGAAARHACMLPASDESCVQRAKRLHTAR